ncbi:MAG: hypothetical protein KJT03_20980, partial [Verrucomicrobiae bacterium]|nr:hypothetical protein [Verrucomicrobiae bacterium]
RALLAVDRALLTDLTGEEPELLAWPLPYQAMAWMIANYREETFVGNPRVHFQHLASRIRGERADQRRWRAWACWYLTRQVKPALPGDAKQGIIEPAFEAIDKGLENHGISGEAAIWRSVLEKHS